MGEESPAKILPQQELFLELLIMSGDIAITESTRATILHRTLEECEAAGWVRVSRFGAGFNKARITETGRRAIKEKLPG